MGAKFAPTYANLYMGWWEEIHLFGGKLVGVSFIKLYKRYVDDLLLVWRGSESQFSSFVESLNHNDCNLRFTFSFDHANIDFLDLKLMSKSSEIVSTVYRKKSAGNSLLRADSCHPKHIFKAVPIGQFQRLRRNCMQLRDRFLARGYPLSLLEIAFVRALREDRNALLSRSHSNSTTVSRHFLECSNCDVNNLKIQGIEKIYQSSRGGDKTAKLRYREAYWIFTMDTRQPKGLNLRFDVVCHV
ncbi:hypothetical protein XELAEV_18013121mg [Xenopus laevis]|uniref:Helix-turn-helix domain-containing protein n=1 Tax=Xenopus laevis TaxID=8355 RepID=A0A974HYS3_XENLA|nr:hypothetical protein XELAEV_18013121mg [Xenopus laevis]